MKHLIAAVLIAPTMALAQFHTDAALREVESCTPQTLSIETTAALVSFAYSIGPDRFCHTTVADLVNRGQIARACKLLERYAFDEWGGKTERVARRRAVERNVCEGAK